MQLEDIIKYENENTTVDFKSTQYRKEQNEAFIKDVISMANADVKEDKYIIIGLKHIPHGEKEIIGIRKEEFVDAATYQQLIYENVEPEIDLDYFPYEYDGKLLGIFKIANCFEKPYMLKKDYKNLKKGDCYIRKGSQQMKMVRSDYIKLFDEKKKVNMFQGLVRIEFDAYQTNRIRLKPFIIIEDLPSKKAATKIQNIIHQKKTAPKEKNGFLQTFNLANNLGQSLFGTPYEDRTVEELKKNLTDVNDTYRKHDYHFIYEQHSYKLNLKVFNESNDYIEDASIQIYLDKIPGVLVASKFHEEPNKNMFLAPMNLTPSYESLHYPNVEVTESEYIISEEIGDIRHHIPVQAFKVPIRLVITPKAIAGQLVIQCKLFGKNMPLPLSSELIIDIEETI